MAGNAPPNQPPRLPAQGHKFHPCPSPCRSVDRFGVGQDDHYLDRIGGTYQLHDRSQGFGRGPVARLQFRLAARGGEVGAYVRAENISLHGQSEGADIRAYATR